jgi:exosortase A
VSPPSSVLDGDVDVPSTLWTKTLGFVLVASVGIVLAYWETASSMVSIWIRSDTFAHGFLIAPISAWLAWDKRSSLAGSAAVGSWLPLVGMVPVGSAWLVGRLVDVMVIQQYAFVTMLILGTWAVLGTRLARLLAFPLAFLLFAVPVGEGLVYPMMNFTADFTVAMLRATGVPVFRDGTFFSIPTGDWSVVEACSGVRYLIASVTLGALYAYLTYTSLLKRLVFCLFAIAVPVLANGVRAYMIVMIGHLSGMKYAVGVDHLLYGWLFFGVVVAGMFFVGSYWRDPIPPASAVAADRFPLAKSFPGPMIGAVLGVLVAAIWPALGWHMSQDLGLEAKLQLDAATASAPWALAEPPRWDWRPHVVGVDDQVFRFYQNKEVTIGVYLGVYAGQGVGSELVSSENQMVLQKHPVWSEKERVQRYINVGGERLLAEQSRLARITGERLLVWSWYRVWGQDTSDAYKTKLREVFLRLKEGRQDGALVAVATMYTDRQSDAEATLTAFLDDMLPALRRVVDEAVVTP